MSDQEDEYIVEDIKKRIKNAHPDEVGEKLVALFFSAYMPEGDEKTLIYYALEQFKETLELKNHEYAILNKQLAHKREIDGATQFCNHALIALNKPVIISIVNRGTRNVVLDENSEQSLKINAAVERLVAAWKPDGGANLSTFLNNYLPKEIADILRQSFETRAMSLDAPVGDDEEPWSERLAGRSADVSASITAREDMNPILDAIAEEPANSLQRVIVNALLRREIILEKDAVDGSGNSVPTESPACSYKEILGFCEFGGSDYARLKLRAAQAITALRKTADKPHEGNEEDPLLTVFMNIAKGQISGRTAIATSACGGFPDRR